MKPLFFIVYWNISDYSAFDGPYESFEIALNNVNFAGREDASDACIVQLPCFAKFERSAYGQYNHVPL